MEKSIRVFWELTEDRDGLNYLMDKVKCGECDTIVVYKIDRLMRSFSEGVSFIKFLLDNEIKIISTTEDVNSSTTSGRFFINMLLSLSELERDTIVDRLMNGKRKKFNESQRHSGRISFGYSKRENQLIVNESESKIVRYIFKKHSELLKRDLTKTKRTQHLLKLLKRHYNAYSHMGGMGVTWVLLPNGL